MKTVKALKTAIIWNCLFCISCILSTVCLAIGDYYDADKMFSIGILAAYGWMVNPFAILSCIKCLKFYLAERTNPDDQQIIGRKWIWIFIFPVITTVLWILGSLLFVKFTGGV